MKAAKRFLNYARYITSSKLMLVGVFMLALVGVVTANITGNQTATYAADCSPNAIIKCGVTSTSQLAAKINENAHGDMQNIMAHYGINAANATQMVPGIAHKNGDITVGGRVVAKNGMSIGRQKLSYSKPKVIAGKTYHESASTQVFRSNQLQVFVLMKDNKFVSGVILDCGNPITGNPTPPPPPPPAPEAECTNLTVATIDRTRFKLTATGSVKNGATISEFHFYIHDQNNQPVTSAPVRASNNTAETTLSVDKPGTYTARAYAITSVGNRTSNACAKQITVAEKPVYTCDALTANLVGKAEDRTFKYNLSYTAAGGATLQTVDFDFGDGQKREGVTPAELNNVTHTYAREGNYTTTATLQFNVGDKVESIKCKVVIKAVPDVCPTNPSLPKDHPDCAPCPIPGYEHLGKDDPTCKETPEVPVELPTTGPAGLIGALGLGSVTASGVYWARSRRDLIGAFLGR